MTFFEQLRDRSQENPYSKTAVFAERSYRLGPTLHLALNWIGPRRNWTAVAGLLSGDWCLGAHAGNFYGKPFIPKSSNHVQDCESVDVEPSRVCLSCWHWRRQMCTDDEGHVCFECPAHEVAREHLLSKLSADTRAAVDASGSGRCQHAE